MLILVLVLVGPVLVLVLVALILVLVLVLVDPVLVNITGITSKSPKWWLKYRIYRFCE